jgi:putative two-component system response regulator
MNILVADDDAGTLALLDKCMTKWGYHVLKASNGRQALELITDQHVDIIVSDWLMPEINGLELCAQVRALNLAYYIYIILISAQDTRTDVVRGLKGGVDDFIAKPFNLDELQARLEVGARIINLERELNQKFLTIKRNYFQTVQMFNQLLEIYNENLGGHCRRVGQLATDLADRHPEIQPEDYPVVQAAGLLHDIGLIGLPDTLVTKRLTEMTGEEKELYHTHSERGEMVLNEIDLLRPVSRLVRMHHEQSNGKGFPDALVGDQVPLAAKVISAASTYDNLVYRDKIPLEGIPEKLQQQRGYQIDPDLVDMLLEINLSNMQQEALKTDKQVALDELTPGMILSQDVRMRTGAFVMASNTAIDAASIEKLKRYYQMGNIIDKVFISK